MARIGTRISLIAAASLVSSTLLVLAQTGGSTGGATGGGGTSAGTSTGTSTGTATNSNAPGGVGQPGPGGVPIAPGPSRANVPTQRTGPGGGPIAPGPAGDLGGGIQGTDSATLGSGRPCPPSGSPSGGGTTASRTLGPPAQIMADEPGRPGQSTGADAGSRTTGAGTTAALGTTTGTTQGQSPTGIADSGTTNARAASGC
jgi:hypothetical protein